MSIRTIEHYNLDYRTYWYRSPANDLKDNKITDYGVVTLVFDAGCDIDEVLHKAALAYGVDMNTGLRRKRFVSYPDFLDSLTPEMLPKNVRLIRPLEGSTEMHQLDMVYNESQLKIYADMCAEMATLASKAKYTAREYARKLLEKKDKQHPAVVNWTDKDICDAAVDWTWKYIRSGMSTKWHVFFDRMLRDEPICVDAPEAPAAMEATQETAETAGSATEGDSVA